jgi:hypothetical protein
MKLHKIAKKILREQDDDYVWDGDYNPQIDSTLAVGILWGIQGSGYDGPNTSNGQLGCSNVVASVGPITEAQFFDDLGGKVIMDYCLQNGILPCVFSDYVFERSMSSEYFDELGNYSGGGSFGFDDDPFDNTNYSEVCLVHDQNMTGQVDYYTYYIKFGQYNFNADNVAVYGGMFYLDVQWTEISSLQEFFDLTQNEIPELYESGLNPENISSWAEMESLLENNVNAEYTCEGNYCVPASICQCICNEEGGCEYGSVFDDPYVNTDTTLSTTFPGDLYNTFDTAGSCTWEVCCDWDAPGWQALAPNPNEINVLTQYMIDAPPNLQNTIPGLTGGPYGYCIEDPEYEECYDYNWYSSIDYDWGGLFSWSDEAPNTSPLTYSGYNWVEDSYGMNIMGCLECLANTCDVNKYIMYYGPEGPLCNPDLCEYTNYPGCTDPIADNYNEYATEDDGSCTYPTYSCDTLYSYSIEVQQQWCDAYYYNINNPETSGTGINPQLAQLTNNGQCCEAIEQENICNNFFQLELNYQQIICDGCPGNYSSSCPCCPEVPQPLPTLDKNILPPSDKEAPVDIVDTEKDILQKRAGIKKT